MCCKQNVACLHSVIQPTVLLKRDRGQTLENSVPWCRISVHITRKIWVTEPMKIYVPQWELPKVLWTTTLSEHEHLVCLSAGWLWEYFLKKIHNSHALKRPSFQQDWVTQIIAAISPEWQISDPFTHSFIQYLLCCTYMCKIFAVLRIQEWEK